VKIRNALFLGGTSTVGQKGMKAGVCTRTSSEEYAETSGQEREGLKRTQKTPPRGRGGSLTELVNKRPGLFTFETQRSRRQVREKSPGIRRIPKEEREVLTEGKGQRRVVEGGGYGAYGKRRNNLRQEKLGLTQHGRRNLRGGESTVRKACRVEGDF